MSVQRRAIRIGDGFSKACSLTHASLANHPWLVRQNGQCACAKNTGDVLNRAAPASIPVGIARSVTGHLIMSLPIAGAPRVHIDEFAADRTKVTGSG